MPASGTPTTHQQLIAECRSALLGTLEEFVVRRGFRMAETRDAMLRAAGDCFDELARLRGRRGFERAHGLTASRISLISEDDLNFTLELTGLAKLLREECGVVLSRLHPRFVTLLDQEDAAAEQLPVGPEAVCRALRGLIECAGLDPDQRVDLLEKWAAEMAAHLRDFYTALDARLEKAGIRARSTFAPWTATGKDSDTTPAAAPLRVPTLPPMPPPAAAATAPTAPAAAPSAWPTLPGQEAAAPSGAWPPAARDAPWPLIGDQPASLQAQLRDRLLQDRVRAAGAAGALDPQLAASIIDQVRAWLTRLQHDTDATIPAIGSSALGHLLAPETAAGVEVLERILAHVAGLAELPAPIQRTLRTLQVPLLKLALDDARLALDPEHPVYRLIDALVLAANTLPASSAEHQGYVRIQAMGEQLSRVTQLQATHLEAARGPLHRLAEDRRRAAYAASDAALDIAGKAERREIARIFASRALGALLDAGTPAPIQRFLTTYWIQVLISTLYRQGDKHPDWRSHLEVANQLVLTGTTDSAGKMSAAAASQLPQLLNRISIRLTSMGLGAEAQRKALADCVSLHAALLAGRAPEITPYIGHGEAAMTLSRARDIQRLRMLHHTGYTAGQVSAPGWMARGTWVELTLPDDSKLHGCISWVGPAAKAVLIADPDAGNLLAATTHCLVDLRASERCRVAMDASVTEQATRAALQRLDG